MATEIALRRSDPLDERIVGRVPCLSIQWLPIHCRPPWSPVQRRGHEAEWNRLGNPARHVHREDDVGDRADGLLEPVGEADPLNITQLQETRDGGCVDGPLEQGSGVHRAVIGAGDAESGGGQPVQGGRLGEHRAGQTSPAAGGLRVEQGLGDPAVLAPGERRVETPRSERVLGPGPTG